MTTTETLVPEPLWQAIQPLLPTPPPRSGGRPRFDDRAALAVIIYQLRTGVPWRLLLDQLGQAGQLDWSRASLDSISVRAKRGALTGPNPVDRGKPGSKYHLLTDRRGIPLAVGLSAANTHDSVLLKAMVDAVPPVKGPARPARSTPQVARQAPRRQGLRLPALPTGAAPARHHAADRPT
jgi:hypothetical protein